MNLHFKYNGKELNNPTEQWHIDIQTNLRQKLNIVLEPIKDEIDSENGVIILNYDDAGEAIPVYNGYSGGTTVAIGMLLDSGFNK